VTRAADRLRWGIVGLMWAGFVLGALGITVKGALVLAPSLAARTVAVGLADLLLTAGLAIDLAATAAGAYERLAWWDDLTHTALPALLVPVAAAAVVGATGRCSPRAAWAVVLAVAGAWELVELACDATMGTGFNLGVADSALDLACGVLGATLGAYLLPAAAGRAPMPALPARALRGRA
jgi:hypothetical protein